METKFCSICNNEKELSEFYSQKKHTKTKGDYIYHNPECKECTIRKTRNWQSNNREKRIKINSKYDKSKKGRLVHNNYQRKFRESGRRKEWQINNKDKLKNYGLYRMNKNHKITNKEWEWCKNYFNYRCAYCGIPIEEHYVVYKGKQQLGDFHKEHVDHEGANDLSNCVPSCKNCNIHKWAFKLEEWYKEDNENFSNERLQKIHNWLQNDYKLYIKYNRKYISNHDKTLTE